MAVAIMPGLFVAVVTAGRNQLIQNGRHVSLQPSSNSIVPTAAVLPMLKTLAIPVLTPEEFTAAATCSVMSFMSP